MIPHIHYKKAALNLFIVSCMMNVMHRLQTRALACTGQQMFMGLHVSLLLCCYVPQVTARNSTNIGVAYVN
jgi:hypothetical protein